MKRNRKIMYGAGFLFTLSLGLIYYITSTYLSNFMSEGRVGIVYTVASMVSLLGLLMAPIIFRKIGGYFFLMFAALAGSALLAALAFANSAFSASLIFILSFPFNTVILFALDEFLKIFSEDDKIGSIRGVYLSVCHIALIGAQIAFWMGLGRYSFRTIFLIASVVILLFFLLVAFRLKNIPEPKYDQGNPLKFVVKFFRNKKLARAYGISFLLQIFYAWMIIYTPLYLSHHLGFNWQEIGIILGFMLVPFLFIPYRLGGYGDRYGERKMLMLGFAVASLATLLLHFITLRGVAVWAVLLFLTRIGAATIETMADAYFFKHIRPENEEYIGVYRSASPMAFILGPLFASTMFLILPTFSFIYVVLSVIMLYGVYLASTIRKTDI